MKRERKEKDMSRRESEQKERKEVRLSLRSHSGNTDEIISEKEV